MISLIFKITFFFTFFFISNLYTKVTLANIVVISYESFNNKEKWRIAVGGEFGTKVFPFRIGLFYGGYDKMSVGMGFGLHVPSNKGSFGVDFGISYKGNIDINSSNGIDFGLGIYWTQN